MPDESEETSILTVPGMYEDGVVPQQMKKRTKRFDVYYTEEEYEYLKKIAKQLHFNDLSSFSRHVLLSMACGRITLPVSTNDLDELNENIAEINMHIKGVIGGLRFQEDLYASDIERLENLLSKVNEQVITINKRVYENRYSIRKQGVRALERRFNRLLVKEKKEG
jgi:hypothetical protein